MIQEPYKQDGEHNGARCNQCKQNIWGRIDKLTIFERRGRETPRSDEMGKDADKTGSPEQENLMLFGLRKNPTESNPR
jgi:hypothetical protein